MESQTWRENPPSTVQDSNPTFISFSKRCMSFHVWNTRMNTRMLWCLQQDFDVLILECFESGINVSINTVCAWCSDTTYYEMDSRCEWKANQHLNITTHLTPLLTPRQQQLDVAVAQCAHSRRLPCADASRMLALLACLCSPTPLLHRRPPALRRISCAGLPTPSCSQLDITGVRSVPTSAYRTLPAPLPPPPGGRPLFLSAGHATHTMTIEAACASLCNETTFVDAVSATAPPSSLAMLIICIIYQLNQL